MVAAPENAEVVEIPLDEDIVLPSDEEKKGECLEAFSTEPQGPSSNRISDNDEENSAHVVADIMQFVSNISQEHNVSDDNQSSSDPDSTPPMSPVPSSIDDSSSDAEDFENEFEGPLDSYLYPDRPMNLVYGPTEYDEDYENSWKLLQGTDEGPIDGNPPFTEKMSTTVDGTSPMDYFNALL